jgi:uncharacterized protein (UPF0371 family)
MRMFQVLKSIRQLTDELQSFLCHIEGNAVEPRYLVKTNHLTAKAALLHRRRILKAFLGLIVITSYMVAVICSFLSHFV